MESEAGKVIIALMIILGAFGAIACLVCAIVTLTYKKFKPGLLVGMVLFAGVFVLGIAIASPEYFRSFGSISFKGSGARPGATVSVEGTKKFIKEYYPEFEKLNEMIDSMSSGAGEKYSEADFREVLETMGDAESELLYRLVTLSSSTKNTNPPRNLGARETIEGYLKEVIEDADKGVRYVDVSYLYDSEDAVKNNPILLPKKLLGVINSSTNLNRAVGMLADGKANGSVQDFSYSLEFVEEMSENDTDGAEVYAAKYKFISNVQYAPTEDGDVFEPETHETIFAVGVRKYTYGWRVIEFSVAY